MTSAAAENDPRNSATNTQRGRPFELGNPGKPKGARHRVTRAVEALMEGEAEEITRKAIEAAKAGDLIAIRLILDRVAPAPKERTVEFQMPSVESVADVPAAVLSIMQAVAGGTLAPGEGAQVMQMLEAYRKQVETAEFDERLRALEGASSGKR